jgi:transcriptional regulator with XRE-family HTH domain
MDNLMADESAEYKALRDILVEARVSAEMTQRDLALKLRRPQSFVWKIENDVRGIDVVEFIKVARALGVDPAKLLARVIKAADL